MKQVDEQMRLEDVSDEYKAFVEKFKPKKTTDDCYTPENIYQAVLDWVVDEYGVDPKNVVRPFWPGGDYERFPYTEDSVVVDNPPFSICASIVNYYNRREIPYFIFSPYLSNIDCGKLETCHIITGESITYQNGAEVGTAFLTNLDPFIARAVPDLALIIREENKKNLKAMKKELPNYSYPDEVLTSAALGYLAKHGTPFYVMKGDAAFIKKLDAQDAQGKAIFGGGLLLSERAAAERAAAERAAAERAAAERAAATRWQLSDREQEIVKALGRKEESRC